MSFAVMSRLAMPHGELVPVWRSLQWAPAGSDYAPTNTSDKMITDKKQHKQWESKQFGKYTLWRLEPQDNGEERWSLGVYGPAAYLTCDESIAVWIARAVAINHAHAHTHSRAQKGGQLGANGEWYKGGAFINTIPENPKGEAKKRRGTGKQEIEPYKWEVAPEGKMSLFRMLAGVECFNRATMQFSFNGNLRLDYATPEAIARRQERIAAFNRGERWV